MVEVAEHGTTVLWEPDDKNTIIADIIFVHGLGGHPRTTWQYGKLRDGDKVSSAPQKKSLKTLFKSKKPRARSEDDGQPKSSGARPTEAPTSTQSSDCCFWPLHLVPAAFDNVRVLTYGYDSHPSHFYRGKTVQMTITQHSQQLLQSVSDARADCRKRPIIFVAHSLGGILVKDAIVLSGKYEHQPALKDLSVCCSAIVFFGTPHQGANIAAYGEMIGSIVGALPLGPSVNKEILHGLKPDGEKLSNVTADFNDLLNSNIPAENKIQIYSFREGKPLTNLAKFDGKVVPDTSAFFNRRDLEQTSMLMSNHMDMCKFKSAQDPGFVSFRAAVSVYRDSMLSTAAHQRQQYQTDAVRALTEKLDFGARIQRQQQIASLRTRDATFDWIWTSAFSSWLKSQDQLFWIRGKPASGKSTLINYIVKAKKTSQLLSEAFGAEVPCLHYFFDFRAGKGIANNFEGLLRSLLLQLCQRFPGSVLNIPHLRLFVDDHRAQNIENRGMSVMELESSVLQLLNETSGWKFIVLDGLDEYEGERTELISLVSGLKLKHTKLCLACRPEALFTDAFGELPSVRMDELNAGGIYKFTRQTFEGASMQQRFQEDQLRLLADQVVAQSQGVFLWARFAAFEVVSMLARGESNLCENMVKRINSMPEELEDVYSRIITNTRTKDRLLAMLVLNLVANAVDTMKVAMLQAVLGLQSDDLERWFSNFECTGICDVDQKLFEKRILASTGGLVEIYVAADETDESDETVETERLSDVRLLHRTVNSYLEKRGWAEISASSSPPELEHALWFYACITVVERHAEYIRIQANPMQFNKDSPFHYHTGALRSMNNVPQNGPQLRISLGTRLLLAYAVTYLPQHAFLFEERYNMSTYASLGSVFSVTFAMVHTRLSCRACGSLVTKQRSSKSVPKRFPQTGIHLAIGHSLTRFVSDYLEAESKESSAISLRNAGSKMSRLWQSMLHHPSNKEIIRRWAVGFAIHGSSTGPRRLSVLKLALHHCPVVREAELLEATASAPCDVIELLLSYLPPGKLLLKPDDPGLFGTSTIGQKLRLLSKEFDCTRLRPFWAVGQRYSEGTEAVIDVFIARGEDINEQCGPLGTVLHGHICREAESPSYDSKVLSMLLQKGASIDVQGPYGNVLEFVWMLANTSDNTELKLIFPYVDMINDFINAGAINNRSDPNGLVPSVERMRRFARSGDDFLECKRFYKDGPLPPRVVPARWQYAGSEDERMDLARRAMTGSNPWNDAFWSAF